MPPAKRWPILPLADIDAINPYRPGPMAAAFRLGFLHAEHGYLPHQCPLLRNADRLAWHEGAAAWYADREQRIVALTDPDPTPDPSQDPTPGSTSGSSTPPCSGKSSSSTQASGGAPPAPAQSAAGTSTRATPTTLWS